MSTTIDPIEELHAKFVRCRDDFNSRKAATLIDTKSWEDMDQHERRLCLWYAVSRAHSETELCEFLLSELDLVPVSIAWCEKDFGDREALQEKLPVHQLGWLFSASGALVSVIVPSDF